MCRLWTKTEMNKEKLRPPVGTWVNTMHGTGIVGDDGNIHLNGSFMLNGKKVSIGIDIDEPKRT